MIRTLPSVSELKKRIAMAVFLGVPVKLYKDDIQKWCFYDGKMMHFSSGLSIIDLDHEIGHFLAANQRERTKWEWGLGEGPNYPDDEAIRVHTLNSKMKMDRPVDPFDKDYERRHNKEAAASIYGIAITYTIGKKNQWRDHASDHNWDGTEHACNLFCLIRPSPHFYLKNRLTKLLHRLEEFRA